MLLLLKLIENVSFSLYTANMLRVQRNCLSLARKTFYTKYAKAVYQNAKFACNLRAVSNHAATLFEPDFFSAILNVNHLTSANFSSLLN